MKYTTFQAIILIGDTLNLIKKEETIDKVTNLIKNYTRRINVLDKEVRNLAYEINNNEEAWFIAIEFSLKIIGARKRVKIIEEGLNTIENILSYKIVEKDKRELQKTDNTIYIVYEFDCGDEPNEIEPRVTHFGGFYTREDAIKKANELLDEGLEEYLIGSYLADDRNPFENNDEVHLYESKVKEEQGESAYYIKIEKMILN